MRSRAAWRAVSLVTLQATPSDLTGNCANFVSRSLGPFVEIPNADVRPFGREGERRGATDAAGPARDDGNPIFQLEVHRENSPAKMCVAKTRVRRQPSKDRSLPRCYRATSPTRPTTTAIVAKSSEGSIGLATWLM